MPVSAVIRERCREVLGPDQDIRYVFPATSMPPGLMMNFFVVVTDRSIVLLSARNFRRDQPSGVWGTYPRRTRLGPIESGAGSWFEFAGMMFEVDEEYIPVIAAADAEAFSPGDLPRDPLPDL
jgi:hypothetical protein